MLLKSDEAIDLAPIAVVMLPKRWLLCVAAAFERKAGSPFLNTLSVSLLKKIELFIQLCKY